VLNVWYSLAAQALRLSFEAQIVIALRMMRLASGQSSHGELYRMASEKPTAWIEAQAAAASALMGGKSAIAGRKMLAVYQKRVRANRRRLSGS
jgi:hypothetical protein